MRLVAISMCFVFGIGAATNVGEHDWQGFIVCAGMSLFAGYMARRMQRFGG